MKARYREQWMFFKEGYKRYFISYVLLAILSGAVAYGYLVHHPDAVDKVMNYVIDLFKKKGVLPNYDAWLSGITLAGSDVIAETKTGVSIFINNLIALTVLIALGFFSWMILPLVYEVVAVVFNGALVGAVMAHMQQQGENPLKQLAFGILPHGITEFIAIFAATAIGTHIGITVMKLTVRSVGHPEEAPDCKAAFKALCRHALQAYILVLVPLLVISACIEAYITPLLLH